MLAAFGTGNMVEANSVADTLEFSLRDVFGYAGTEERVFSVKLAIGLAYAALVWRVIVGGVKRIGGVVSRLVPLMFLVYLVSALVVLVIKAEAIPGALAQMITAGGKADTRVLSWPPLTSAQSISQWPMQMPLWQDSVVSGQDSPPADALFATLSGRR